MMTAALLRCNRAAVSNASASNTLGRLTNSTVISSKAAIAGRNFLPSLSTSCVHRYASSTSYNLHYHKPPDGVGQSSSSSIDVHALYQEQMKEIQSEREAIFGKEYENTTSDSPDLSQAAKSYFETDDKDISSEPFLRLPPGWNAKEEEALHVSKKDSDDILPQQQSSPGGFLSSPSSSSTPLPSSSPSNASNGQWNAQELEEAYAEREAIYEFSDEEKSAWSLHNNTDTLSASHMHKIREMIRGEATSSSHDHNHDHITDNTSDSTQQPISTSSSPSQFSHLTPKGDGVSMVDVGNKVSTRRVAIARSVVVFPPEVLSAFQVSTSNNEMVGPKGPIFETAKIAGIMGAKKTSDLIPLCHPLPLDRVNINIQLINNQAIIECECRVTHKTGVEMEALTGATIAALTIYDMVKAVSHNIEIGQTVLVSKSGGKSDYSL